MSEPTVALHNGSWLPSDQLAVPIDDQGFRQAVTAVERLRTYGGKPFQIQRHEDRWRQTLRALKIDGVPTGSEVLDWNERLLRRNQSFLSEQGDIGITWLATPGIPGHGSPTFMMKVQALDHARHRQRVGHGQPLVLSQHTLPPATCWSRQIKVRSRLHYYLADQEAQTFAPDAIAVLLDQNGSLTETSIANIAIVRDGQIVAPIPEQVLPGVTQSCLEDLAAEAGLNWQSREIQPQELGDVDGVLLMGTDPGLWWANSVTWSEDSGGNSGQIRNFLSPPTGFTELRNRFDALTGG